MRGTMEKSEYRLKQLEKIAELEKLENVIFAIESI